MTSELDDSAIAIVGMAGRFPGAHNVGELWQLLRDGRDALSCIPPEELIAAGVNPALIDDPNYVKYHMKFEGADLFDADFFGFSPRQATNIDPQQRVFLECAWEALESAGCNPNPEEESIGVFAGSGLSGLLLRQPSVATPEAVFEQILDNDKDFLTTRVAYKLGLTGPCITVQTACSTSLVAVHLACQSLLAGECDVALAGGVSISQQSRGYRYVEHGILSPDGRCRAFDAEAKGTVPGSGVALVVLRRLADALHEKYPIDAVIRSSIVNNDGSQKVGFTAPGLASQRQLLAKGLVLAGLQPGDIGYLEAHGTGTVLGDSIELTALKEVYGGSYKRCALGSIKTNIGHLDAAAGVAGLIKAVLCLKNRALVPSLGCVTPNPILQSSDSPFFVSTTFQNWPSEGNQPRRAAVSSFGMGGTNAHVILEEAPELTSEPNGDRAQILPVSARTPHALNRSCANLADYLEQHPNQDIADVAHTLQVGRHSFPYRHFVVGCSSLDLVPKLRDESHPSKAPDNRRIVFLFPFEGSERPGMVEHLYRTEEYFREELDQCAERVRKLSGFDIRRFLCEGEALGEESQCHTAYTQPALFAAEFSLARLWMNWGIVPSAMLGHGLGEYVAAAVAGALSIDDVTKLVVERSRFINELPEGRMMVVKMPEEALRCIHGPELAIAAINSATQCVVAGPPKAIKEFDRVLEAQRIAHYLLPVRHALYSPMMQPAVRQLMSCASALGMKEPDLEYVSATTGTSVSGQQIKDSAYWGQQLTGPVRFSQALATLQGLHDAVFLEVGPGCALSELARERFRNAKDFVALPSLPGSGIRGDVLGVLGDLWVGGATVGWKHLHQGQARLRVQLPTYPFERRQFILDSAMNDPVAEQQDRKKPATDLRESRFYIPSWKESLPWGHWKEAGSSLQGLWVVFEDETGFGVSLSNELRAAGLDVVSVVAANAYRKVQPDRFLIDPQDPESYVRLLSQLNQRENEVWRILHCWSLTAAEGSPGNIEQATARGYRSLLFLTQALSELPTHVKRSVLAVTSHLFDVAGELGASSVQAAIPAICAVAAQEITNLRCGVIDVFASSAGSTRSEEWNRCIGPVLAEASLWIPDPIVAYRGRHRFARSYEQVRLDWTMPRVRSLREKGVYLITGGLGRIGLVLGEDLARRCQARLVLLTRSPSPGVEQERGVALSADGSSPIYRERALRRMEAAGAEVLVATADVSSQADVQRVLSQARLRFGEINGVFHLAGDISHPSIRRPLAKLDRTDVDTQMRPKVGGFNVLVQEFGDKSLDFGVVFSSNASILGGVGFGAYASANAVLDHIVTAKNQEQPCRWLVTNWDGWFTTPVSDQDRREQVDSDPFVVTAEEGLDALWRIVSLSTVSQVVITKANLDERLDTWVRQQHTFVHQRPSEMPTQSDEGRSGRRSDGSGRTALEKSIVEIWEEVLGVSDIAPSDNFLDLGGDSLIALRVIVRVKELVGVSLPPALFVNVGCTVEMLAKEIVATVVASHGTKTLEQHLELTE